MSLGVAVAVLAFAVLLGGVAAFSGERGRSAMPALRAFAVVAAAAIALVHLLPEAIEAAGFITLLAAAAGALVPVALERAVHPHEDHAPHAPTAALAMGYAAVIVHQAGEGAALATLARIGALTIGLVLALAAHTVPLAMVVALRVLEVRRHAQSGHGEVSEAQRLNPDVQPKGTARATILALAGIALATAAGAMADQLVGTALIARAEPWVLATAAGLLLHALAHDVFERGHEGRGARVRDGLAAFAGVCIAFVGLEPGAWAGGEATILRIVGAAVLLVIVFGKIVWPKAGHHHH